MKDINKIEKIESLIYTNQLSFDFNNELFLFKKKSDILISSLQSYLISDDIDFRKAGVFIILKSKIYEKSLLFPLFKFMSEYEDKVVQNEFFVYLNNNYELYLNFMYRLIYNLKEEDIDYFIKLITVSSNEDNFVFPFFLLETYQLNENQIKKLYLYLFNNQLNLARIEDYYYNSNFINNFVESLKTDKKLVISYDDFQNNASLIQKKLRNNKSLGYFFNKDEEEYQIIIRLSNEELNYFDDVSNISFNAFIHFPKNLIFYFKFETEVNFDFKVDLYLDDIVDKNFLNDVLKNKIVKFIFVNEYFEISHSFDFVFAKEVLYKLVNQAVISNYFKDFEWIQLEENLSLIEDGKFVVVDIPVSLFRKIHYDLSLIKKTINLIEKKEDITLYFKHLNPVFYTKADFDILTSDDLEILVRNYIIEVDKNYPYLMLYLSNIENSIIKYMSYLLPENFTEDDLKREVIKRMVFIAQYLNARGIIYYDIIKETAKKFKIELTEQFMNKLADSFEAVEQTEKNGKNTDS